MVKADWDDRMEEALRKVILAPYKEYAPETSLMIGSAGLLMNAVYGKLNYMQTEFRHAGEFLAKNQAKDVEETMQEYGEKLGWMKKQLLQKKDGLMECRDEDEETRLAVAEFISVYAELISELEQDSNLQKEGMSCEEQTRQYLDGLTKASEFCSRYLKIHLGENSYLSDKK